MFGLRIVVSLLWTQLAVCIGHRQTAKIGFVFLFLGNLTSLFVPHNAGDGFLHSPAVWIQSSLFTIGWCCWNTVGPSMLANVVDYDYYLWGKRR